MGLKTMRAYSLAGLAMLLSLAVLTAEAAPSAGRNEAIRAAGGVMQRLLGKRATAVRMQLLPAGTADRYEYSASGGIVTLKGTSAIALTRGVYEYLRTYCHCMVAWSGSHLDLPEKFPDAPRTQGETPYEFRQYFNVCTFGYTTVWWDWERWERELDWMALHGINMPLAMVGQEAVWVNVWKSFGIGRRELDDFFTGPAFLPWHRMSNVNKHGGPLSDEWIQSQKELQKKILARARELGMTPIAPAFSGFVPAGIRTKYPSARIMENSNWGNFPPGHQTFVLAPDSPLFIEIGKRFIKEYEKEYGAFGYYLADTFNELKVPVSVEHRYEELAAFGKAVFSSINAGNPKATWVMQGWLFGYDNAFWDKPSVQALLRDVPNDRMLILDLCNELFQGWKAHEDFYGKRWIYSLIHNFGGNNSLFGDMKFSAGHPAEMLAAGKHPALAGFGLAPEGIENNEVMYELMTDAAWSRVPIVPKEWLKGYVLARYGATTPGIEQAWELLREKVYTSTHLTFKHAFQRRPTASPISDVSDTASYRKIFELFLAAEPVLGRSPLFRNDLIEAAVNYFSVVADGKLSDACRAQEAGKFDLRDKYAAEGQRLLIFTDKVMNMRPDLRLEKWIAAARAHAKTEAAQDLLEYNARMQVTVWGGPELFDYASKMWSGLIRDFYIHRWTLYFDGLSRGLDADSLKERIIAWENQWCSERTLSKPLAEENLVAALNDLLLRRDALVRLAPAPELKISKSTLFKGDSSVVSLTKRTHAVVRYTIDGTEPIEASQQYTAPIILRSTAVVIARAFIPGHEPSLPSVVRCTQVDSTNGVLCAYYEGAVSNISDSSFATIALKRTGIVYDLALEAIEHRPDQFAVKLEGDWLVTEPGSYTLYASSDDGSKVFIDGQLVVDNDGFHANQEKSGKVTLTAGRHAVKVMMFEGTGGEALRIAYRGPDGKKRPIPPSALFHPSVPTR